MKITLKCFKENNRIFTFSIKTKGIQNQEDLI